MKKTGFTLLEMVVVVIIGGVLISIALPRFFKMKEYAKSAEAFVNLAAIRQSMERCYLEKEDMRDCSFFEDLDIDNPGDSPNSHFVYSMGSYNTTDYTCGAMLKEGKYHGSWIAIRVTTTDVRIEGSGLFEDI